MENFLDKLNKNTSKKNNTDFYTVLDKQELQNIKINYKVIDVYWLDPIQVNYKINADKILEKSPKKKEMINIMLNYYLNHKDISIYKFTDYLCNKKEKICICNIHAEDLRKIYDQSHYINNKFNKKFISWYNL